MRLSARGAAEYRGFWDLPEDFEYDVATPTVVVERSQSGKLHPDDAADAFLAASDPRPGKDGVAIVGAGRLDVETLAALLDEKLSRREVKNIQSGYKDSDRCEKWIAVLQARVPYEDPIVLPAGEGLNIVRRRSDGLLVHRCDCGHDFCAHN